MLYENVLVVGLGEVGRSLYELLMESKKFAVYGFDLNLKRMKELGTNYPTDTVDVIHICIPYVSRTSFIDNTLSYIKRHNPKLTIVNSTVSPGTTEEIYRLHNCNIAHSPVRGVHKSLSYMKKEIKKYKKYVGGVNIRSTELAVQHFRKLGLEVEFLRSSRETELAKLLETTYRAYMIVFFQEMHRTSRYFKVDFMDAIRFLHDTHLVRGDRPVMFPDVIGGHCLIPNTRLLLEAKDSKLLRFIISSNKTREEEVKDKTLAREVDKIRQWVKQSQKYHLESQLSDLQS